MPGYQQDDGSVVWKKFPGGPVVSFDEYLQQWENSGWRNGLLFLADGREEGISKARALELARFASAPPPPPVKADPKPEEAFFAGVLRADYGLTCCGIREVAKYFCGKSPKKVNGTWDRAELVRDVHKAWGDVYFESVLHPVFGATPHDAWYNWMQKYIQRIQTTEYQLWRERDYEADLPVAQARVFNCLSRLGGEETQGELKNILLNYVDAQKSHVRYRNVNTGNIVDTIVIVIDRNTKMLENKK